MPARSCDPSFSQLARIHFLNASYKKPFLTWYEIFTCCRSQGLWKVDPLACIERGSPSASAILRTWMSSPSQNTITPSTFGSPVRLQTSSNLKWIRQSRNDLFSRVFQRRPIVGSQSASPSRLSSDQRVFPNKLGISSIWMIWLGFQWRDHAKGLVSLFERVDGFVASTGRWFHRVFEGRNVRMAQVR